MNLCKSPEWSAGIFVEDFQSFPRLQWGPERRQWGKQEPHKLVDRVPVQFSRGSNDGFSDEPESSSLFQIPAEK